jgi:glutaredoxin 3
VEQVVIFTNVGCSACHQAIAYFERNEIPFVERNIADDPVARDELLSRGFRATPVIQFGNETMVGFSEPKIRKMLGLVK